MGPPERQKSVGSGFRPMLQQGKGNFWEAEGAQGISVASAGGKAARFTDSPCPRFLSSAGLLHPLQMSCGEQRLQLQWSHQAGEVQLPPAPPAQKRSGFGQSFREEKKRKEEVGTPPGWFIPPAPGSCSPRQRQPQEHFSLLPCPHSSARLCPFAFPRWPCPLAPGPALAPGQGLQV